MTTPDTERAALSRRAGHILFTQGPEQPAATARETCVLLDLLAAAEHRATRAEAQAAIRGRAVVIYQQRAREAEARIRDLTQEVLDERGAALDALEQIKVRDARIKAVRELHQPEESVAFPACPEGCCGWCAGCGTLTPCDTIRTLGSVTPPSQ